MTGKRSLPGFSPSCRKAVQAELRNIIGHCPPHLGNILRYHMGWLDERGRPCSRESGKFLRSTLCLLSCEAVGGDTSRALPAAAAIELVHNFSLIHDDIEDASYERHHRPTVWRLWGESQAINAGDAMFALAYSALPRLKESGIPDEKIVTCIEMLSLACLELCEGQYLDMEYESRYDVAVEDYLNMAAKKTGALLGVATSLGAYLGGADARLVDAFSSFGGELGIVFQIRDDILGIWGSEEGTGKSATDISQKKKSLPVVYALQNGRVEAREKLQKLYSQKLIDDQEVAEVIAILDGVGSRNYAESLAERYYLKALEHLEATGLSASGLAPLKKTASFLLKRES